MHGLNTGKREITTDFQAKDFYLKKGYQIFGVLKDSPQGHERYYLQKYL